MRRFAARCWLWSAGLIAAAGALGCWGVPSAHTNSRDYSYRETPTDPPHAVPAGHKVKFDDIPASYAAARQEEDDPARIKRRFGRDYGLGEDLIFGLELLERKGLDANALADAVPCA